MKKFFLFIFFILVLVIAINYFYNLYKKGEERKEKIIKETNKIIKATLINKILLDPILILTENGNLKKEYMVKFPLRFKFKDIERIFSSLKVNKKVKFYYTKINNKKVYNILVIAKYNQDIFCKIRFIRNKKPKIAIIIDDWGYNLKPYKYLKEIKQPFTTAILPFLKYSRRCMEYAFINKKEIILHLPMQPKRKMPIEKNTILVNMSKSEVEFLLNKFFEHIKYAKGANNHEGSLATEDKRIMNIVLRYFKKNNLFFIDSLTSKNTLGYKIALTLNVKTNKRDVFIDNKKKFDYIERQFEKLKKIAPKRGYAIGIGHASYITMEYLKQNISKFEKQGYEFVYIAEILK